MSGILRPSKMIVRSPIELKLGIKSSLPNAKPALALIYALWKSNDKKTVLNYTKEISSNKLNLSDNVQDNLKNYFKQEMIESSVSEKDFMDAIDMNALLTAQIEHLQVGFELIWRIGIFKLFDSTKAFNSERQGGVRYSKNILFTKNVDIIDLLIQSNEDEYKKILLRWLTNVDIEYDEILESQLIRAFTIISEEAIYKLRIDNNSNNDITFRNEGIYKLFDKGDEKIDILDSKSPAGSLRILKSLVKENLNYFLKADGQNLSIKDVSQLDEIKEYSKRINNFLELMDINVEIKMEDNVEDEEVEVTDIVGNNIIYYGAPGTGKSHTITDKCEELKIKEEFIERIVFYPEYGHDEFIGCYMPCMAYVDNSSEYIGEDGEKIDLPGKPVPYYAFVDGPFTRALVKARNNPDKNVVLIIEELNRADAASVFGEVFQLLDRKDNGESEYEINISNQYSEYLAKNIKGNTYSKGDKISIPKNLSIWATMNTADQGVKPLDTAFKRRWNFEYVKIDFKEAHHKYEKIMYGGGIVTWENFAKTINLKLRDKKVNEDQHIGQYFIDEIEIKDNKRVASKIVSYLFDDVAKFYRKDFFKDENATLSELIEDFEKKEIFEFKFEVNNNEKTLEDEDNSKTEDTVVNNNFPEEKSVEKSEIEE